MSRAILPPTLDRWHPVKVVASVSALVALVVGVPVVLGAVGGVPFLHDGLTRMQRSLATGHSGDPRMAMRWIGTIALVLAWSVWAWMTLCVVVELRSWTTGRAPARLPASRTAQSLAAFLVGTTLAVSAIGRGVTVPHPPSTLSSASWAPFGAADRSGTGVVPIADLMTTAAVPRERAGPSVRPSPDEAPPETATPEPDADSMSPSPSSASNPLDLLPSARVHEVGRSEDAPEWRGRVSTPVMRDPLAVPRTHLVSSRETLWSIAETELGTALRWDELAHLNYGITQEDGLALDERHWIRPGWRLLLPPAVNHGEPPAAAPMSVESGPGPRPDRPARLVADVGTTTPADTTDRSDADVAPTVAPAPAPTPGVARAPAVAPAPALAPEPAPAPRSPSVPVVPLGAGVVGAGVVRLLDRMRQVQQRYRAEGGLIKLPDGSGSQFEWRLRIGEGWGLTREVDEAIRLGAGSNFGEHPSTAPVLGVRIHLEVIELVLVPGGGPAVVVDRTTLASTPSSQDAPPPPTRGALPPLADPRAVAPMLITVGRGSSGPVMVNLESLGSLVVSGNPQAADAVVRALALELATSFWSGQFSLVVVGFGSELERFDGVQYFSEVPELIHALCRRRIAAAGLLDSAGYTSFSQARQVESSDRWSPLVVICGPSVVEADVTELLDIASDPVHGTAVVAVGERIEAQYSVRLDASDGVASLELLADVAFPQRVQPEELDELNGLLETAASRQSALTSEEPYVNLPVRVPQPADPHPDPVTDSAAPPTSKPAASPVPPDRHSRPTSETGVEVAVLGPIEIRGVERPFTRAWAEELVVYLAMHPNGASNDAWATALWPDRLMAPSSLHSTASVARRSLGQAPDGSDYLPRSHGRLALSTSVQTDWDRFVVLADTESTEQWHAALSLIRGRPFEGLRSSDWPILEGIAPAIEAAVVDLSGRLAGAYLKLGNARGAEWAARRGLVVSPYDERLYRMLMRASDLGGNPAGVDAAMSELLTLVADGIEPLDAVHPNTMELYRQLSRRKKFGASGG
jgi:nucleoid-associated protein YgaU/DNA-binding SARP family transcriptional activator